MVFAAVRIASRRSSAAVTSVPAGKRKPWVVSMVTPMPPSASRLLDTDGAHFLHVSQASEAFLHAVLLEGAHAVVEALRQHLGDARVLLDQLFQLVGGDQELMQAAASLEARVAALVAADRLVERKLALVIAVGLDPVLVDRLHRALRVGLEARGVHQ